MREVDLKVLKDQLSEYISLAAAGETVFVSDGGEPIVQIKAVPKVPDRYKDHPVLARGIREGWLTPAKNPGAPLPAGKPIPGYTLEQLLADLDEDRKDPWC